MFNVDTLMRVTNGDSWKGPKIDPPVSLLVYNLQFLEYGPWPLYDF